MFCSECGSEFESEDLVNIKGAFVCGGCKPIVIQRAEENIEHDLEFKTAGFGIRFGAAIIDGIIGMIIGKIIENLPGVGMIWSTTFGLLFGVAYAVYFIGTFGATPGKMICNIKIIVMGGAKVSYGLALGRYFAGMLSGLILFIGYLMIAFDKKYAQGLHDRICNTRVVYVKK